MPKKKRTIVLDIDECLTLKVCDATDLKRNRRIQDRFPGCVCLDLKFACQDSEVEVMQFVAPGWIECLEALIEQGYNLCLFSGGVSERNKLIAQYLQTKLKLSDLAVFSKGDLVKSEEPKGENKLIQRYSGCMKKDLERVGFDLAETLLVDDDASYVKVPDQWPALIVSGGWSEIEAYLKTGDESYLNDEAVDNFLQIPHLVLGFFTECAQMKGESLRSIAETLIYPLSNEKGGKRGFTKETRMRWCTIGRRILSGQ